MSKFMLLLIKVPMLFARLESQTDCLQFFFWMYSMRREENSW